MRAVGDDADGTVLAGAVSRLGGGHVSLDPVMWRTTDADPTWVRVDLPADDDGQATGVQCRADTCLAAGYVGDRLAAWSVRGEDVVRETGLPYIRVSSD